MNIIGHIVVSGNVRRAAQVAIGDCDDLLFLAAKRWDLGNIPNWRAMSNNSVVCNDFSLLPEEFWEGYKGNGEPYGLFNLKLAQAQGRTGETEYPDPEVKGANPCLEETLADKETCCLAEVFLPNISSKEELLETVKLLYRINKHSLALDCHQEATQTIVHKNMRMGIGMTGIAQASPEQYSWLTSVYTELREYDKTYSRIHGFNPSIKLTTIKPSGTLSLLAGVTPGCHPGYSQYFIRRIRISTNSPLVTLCKEHGYNIEAAKNFDGSDDHTTSVVEFPCKYPAGTLLAKDTTAIDQLELVKRLQKDWSDNAVSCTIYYQKDELPTIRKWLSNNYNENLKACSFLLHSDHGFIQAPYEEITEDTYNELIMNTKPILSCEIKETDMELSECIGGACPVK
jgi:hypothetical protein